MVYIVVAVFISVFFFFHFYLCNAIIIVDHNKGRCDGFRCDAPCSAAVQSTLTNLV